MTPLRIFLGTLAILIAGLEAQAQSHDPLCPPDATFDCAPNFLGPERPDRPGRPGRPGRPQPPGHGGSLQPIPPLNPPPFNPPPHQPPHHPPHQPPPYNPPHGQLERREIFVGRYMHNERLDLNMYLERGVEVHSVEIWVNNNYANFANLNLLVDGRVEDSRSNANGAVTLFPRRPVFVDAFGGQHLAAEVLGRSLVDRIVVNYRRAINPGVFDLTYVVNQNFMGMTSLDVGQLVNLYQYRGHRVTAVMVYGSSRQGRGQGDILANGFSQGGVQIFPMSPTFLNFIVTSPSQIGFDLNSLVLRLHGNITINQVVVRLVR